MILSICSEPEVLKIMKIVNIFINIIRIVVPILLIFTLIFKLVRAIMQDNQDNIQKIIQTAPKNVITAILIFLIPLMVRIIIKVTFPNNYYEKCLTTITDKQIQAAYSDNIDKLIEDLKKNPNINNYHYAMTYLKNIKDDEKKSNYQKELDDIYTKIQEQNSIVEPNKCSKYAGVNYDNFRWEYYESAKGPLKTYYGYHRPYTIWAPENVSDLNGASLPLIIWLHGMGEEIGKISIKSLATNGVGQKILNDWKSFNLGNFPAIVVAPQSPKSWVRSEENFKTIEALINYTKDIYNIDMNNIVLMGHSMGADDTVNVSYKMKDTHDYFSALVMFSASSSMSTSPYNKSSDIKNYFITKKLKGYSENTLCKGFFDLIGVPLTVYPGTGHGKVPEKAFREDLNNDGVSDLLYWLFGENANTSCKE